MPGATDKLVEGQSESYGTGIQLSWEDVSIVALPKAGCCGKKRDAQEKVILDGVSGCVHPGQFLSIIGASGAGKTTLLNYLSGRLISKGLRKNGNVKVNGTNRDQMRGF
jgi:ABC-type multidrug transport system ATPase subunit